MFSATLTFAVLLGAVVGAEEPKAEKSPIQIKCHGKLRNHLSAIGGETTGARVEVGTIYLDLKAANEASQTFIQDDNHRKANVTVIGTLRQVTGPELGLRWVIDVEKIDLRDPMQKNEATVTFEGKLTKDDAGHWLIDTTAGKWPLQCPDDKDLSEKMDGLSGKTVTLIGKPIKLEEERFTQRPLVHVESVELLVAKMAQK